MFRCVEPLLLDLRTNWWMFLLRNGVARPCRVWEHIDLLLTWDKGMPDQDSRRRYHHAPHGTE